MAGASAAEKALHDHSALRFFPPPMRSCESSRSLPDHVHMDVTLQQTNKSALRDRSTLEIIQNEGFKLYRY